MEKNLSSVADTVVASDQAVAHMKRHNIAPSPEYYELWYRYFAAKKGELYDEVARVEKQGVALDNDLSEYLHAKYIEGDADVLEKAADSQEALSQILTVIAEFRGKTESHNERLGRQTNKLSEHIESAGIQDLMGEVVGQLKDIHTSGVAFNQKLIASQSEINLLQERLQQAEAESRHDFLTGIYNRRALDDALLHEIDQAELYIKDLSVLMIDIDHFKPFNDKWGHQMGDEVLKAVSKAITKSVRGKDTVARYGGEEFTVVLPETPAAGARVVAENIRKTIANAKLQRKDSQESMGQITVSIGVSRYRLGEDDTVPFFLKRADDALYAAKEGGRNRVVSEL